MRTQRIAAWAGTVVVAVAVIAGLVVIGTPGEQRLVRLDLARVADLRSLSMMANLEWNKRHELPARAEELVDGQSMTRLPLDPESHQPYEYRVTEAERFEVCATFSRRSRAEDDNDFWFHEAGHRCFQFTAGKDAYR